MTKYFQTVHLQFDKEHVFNKLSDKAINEFLAKHKIKVDKDASRRQIVNAMIVHYGIKDKHDYKELYIDEDTGALVDKLPEGAIQKAPVPSPTKDTPSSTPAASRPDTPADTEIESGSDDGKPQDSEQILKKKRAYDKTRNEIKKQHEFKNKFYNEYNQKAHTHLKQLIKEKLADYKAQLKFLKKENTPEAREKIKNLMKDYEKQREEVLKKQRETDAGIKEHYEKDVKEYMDIVGKYNEKHKDKPYNAKPIEAPNKFDEGLVPLRLNNDDEDNKVLAPQGKPVGRKTTKKTAPGAVDIHIRPGQGATHAIKDALKETKSNIKKWHGNVSFTRVKISNFKNQF